jgi:hypothetical protein
MAVDQVVQTYESLSDSERAEFRANVGVSLPAPTPPAANVLWVLVIVILGIVAIGGGLLAFSLIKDGKNAEAIVGFVSAALGAIIGLLAPSPVSGQQN